MQVGINRDSKLVDFYVYEKIGKVRVNPIAVDGLGPLMDGDVFMQDEESMPCRENPYNGSKDFYYKTRGFAPGMILTDELNPEQVRSLRIEKTSHTYIGGFYS